MTRKVKVNESRIRRLVGAVLTADAELTRQPEVTRQIADRRTAAMRELIDALGGNAAEAARLLGWKPTRVYRIRNGKFARSSERRRRERGED